MTIFSRSRGAAALSVAVALGLATPALADDLVVSYQPDSTAVTRSIALDISDINLASVSGRRVLEQRVDRAARLVCAEGAVYGSKGPADYKRCFAEARTEALDAAGLRQVAMR